MEKHLKILILEDLVDDVEIIEHQLKKGEFTFTTKVVETREQYEMALKGDRPDVVLSDHYLPMFDSTQALQLFHVYKEKYHPAAAFILITGTVSEEFAVEIMKKGADDYILKDRLKRLPAAVLNAMEKNRLKDQRRREEEEKLYLFDILQRSLHEIYVIDPETTKFEYVNREALSNLGYSMEEINNKTPSDTIKGFEKNKFKKSIKLAEKSKKGLILERVAMRKNGTTYPIQVHLQVIEQGGENRILANVLDITEAKQLEQQKELSTYIQDSFNYQNTLQESLEKVLEKVCETCSCVAAEIYSREFNQPSSKLLASCNDFITEGSYTGSSLAEEVIETKNIQVYTFTEAGIKKEDINWIKAAFIKRVVGIPIILGEEIIAVIVGYIEQEDIVKSQFQVLSEQVQNKLAGEIKRKKTTEELQKIFDFSPDILAIAGKDGYFKKVNPAMEKILGYGLVEVLAKDYTELIHPNDLHVLEDWKNTRLEANEVAHFENRLLSKSGEYRDIFWSVTPISKGEMHFVVGRDVTETKKHLKAIQKQNKKLAEIAWEQSHVVRAPLTRLLACVEYLEETGNDPDNIFASIKSSAYEIDAIIKGIINKTQKVELYGKG